MKKSFLRVSMMLLMASMTMVSCQGFWDDLLGTEDTPSTPPTENPSDKPGDDTGVWQGAGTATSPYLIKNATDLIVLSRSVNDNGYSTKGVYFKVDTDKLDFSSIQPDEKENHFTPINEFEGTFDGNNVPIVALTINEPEADYVALFRKNKGTVKNVVLDATCSITGNTYVASIAGDNAGTIEFCTNNGTIQATGNAGGIAGVVSWFREYSNSPKGSIADCVNTGNITAGAAGGICAQGGNGGSILDYFSISRCINKGAIKGRGSAGGIVCGGGSISDCENQRNVIASSYIGGIAAFDAHIYNCKNSGDISDDGTDTQQGGFVGGIIGERDENNIEDCVNTGEVTQTVSNRGRVGGICGYDYNYKWGYYFKNNINKGNVNTQGGAVTAYAGAIVGYYATNSGPVGYEDNYYYYNVVVTIGNNIFKGMTHRGGRLYVRDTGLVGGDYEGYFMLKKAGIVLGLVGQGYWGGYYDNSDNMATDDDMVAYTASVDETKHQVVLQKVESGKVPSGQAIMVKAASEESVLAYTAENVSGNFSTNALKGVSEPTAASSIGGTVYALSNENGSLCFKKFTGTLDAHQIYITSNSGVESFPVVTEDGDVLGGDNPTEGDGQNISFTDSKVKALCVKKWDTNGDGEISFTEAAAVTSLGDLFSGNTEIKSFNELQYFTKLTTLDEYAFENCTNLTYITLPEGMKTIGDYAFWGCANLASITIPAQVTSVGYGEFVGCSKLKSITIDGSNKNYQSIDGVLYTKGSEQELLAYPDGKAGTSYTVADGTRSIAAYACATSALTELTLPEFVNLGIGTYAFGYNTTLRTINSYITDIDGGFRPDAFTTEVYQKATVYVPAGMVKAYAEDQSWSNFKNIVER